MDNILQNLNQLSPLAVVALALFIIYLLVQRRNSRELDDDGKEITLKFLNEKMEKSVNSNHHELLDSLARIESKLEKISDNVIFIKSKIGRK